MSTDLALLPATELVALYRARQASPVETTRAVLARAARFQEPYNAFVLTDEDAALAQARESETRWANGTPAGPVDGVPATIKDIVLTKGWPTLRGSRTVDPGQPWDEDAPSTARLREAGAVLIGKTTTPEMGWKGATDSPLTGITRNPWNPDKTPGGSSGGAAVAAALGMGALHIGTDGGGSVRIPSGFTGIFGIKATFGRVPAYPLSPFGTLANVGPMTRTVADGALMLTVISRPDSRDSYALPPSGEDYLAGLEGGVKGLRIAYSPTLCGNKVEPEVARLVAAAARRFEEFGATVEEAEPKISDANGTFITHWFGVAHYLVDAVPEARRKDMDEGLLGIAARGGTYTLKDFVAAQTARRDIATAVNLFFDSYDLLLTPTLPLTAFQVGRPAPNRDAENYWVDWTPFTYPFNLSRHPAATVPCGLADDGLPVGLQIVGPYFAEGRVLRAARAFEAAHPIVLPPAATA